MTSLRSAIVRDLPAFPGAVIDQWLLPFAGDLGWPPAPRPSMLPQNRWRWILARRPLSYFQSLTWEQSQRHIKPADLSPDSLRTMIAFLQGSFMGVQNIYTDGDSQLRQRIVSVLEYLKEHGQLPVAPVLEQHADGLRIWDGNHRLAAYLGAYPWFKIPIPSEYDCIPDELQHYWIATQSTRSSAS